MNEKVIAVEDLHDLAARVVAALGTPDDLAEVVAGSLAEANLAGHDTYGIVRLPAYADQVRSGQVHPAARPEVTRRLGAIAKVSAGRGWGQMPGQPENATAAQRQHDGVPVPGMIWNDVSSLASDLGINVPA